MNEFFLQRSLIRPRPAPEKLPFEKTSHLFQQAPLFFPGQSLDDLVRPGFHQHFAVGENDCGDGEIAFGQDEQFLFPRGVTLVDVPPFVGDVFLG